MQDRMCVSRVGCGVAPQPSFPENKAAQGSSERNPDENWRHPLGNFIDRIPS